MGQSGTKVASAAAKSCPPNRSIAIKAQTPESASRYASSAGFDQVLNGTVTAPKIPNHTTINKLAQLAAASHSSENKPNRDPEILSNEPDEAERGSHW